jgi:hypothetical protein
MIALWYLIELTGFLYQSFSPLHIAYESIYGRSNKFRNKLCIDNQLKNVMTITKSQLLNSGSENADVLGAFDLCRMIIIEVHSNFYLQYTES